MDFIANPYELTQENLLANIGYDFVKIVLGFIVARYIVDAIKMRKWSGWRFLVMNKEELLG